MPPNQQRQSTEDSPQQRIDCINISGRKEKHPDFKEIFKRSRHSAVNKASNAFTWIFTIYDLGMNKKMQHMPPIKRHFVRDYPGEPVPER